MFFFYISFRILFVLVLIFSCYDLNKSDFVTVWTQRRNKLVTDLLEHKFDLRFLLLSDQQSLDLRIVLDTKPQPAAYCVSESKDVISEKVANCGQ